MDQHTLTDVEKPDLPNEKPAQVLLSESVPVLSAEKEEPPHSEVLKTPEAVPIETLPEIVSTTDVTIHELVVCRRVKNRQYISPMNRFSLENGAKPVVWTWMNVLTRQATPKPEPHLLPQRQEVLPGHSSGRLPQDPNLEQRKIKQTRAGRIMACGRC